MSEVPCFTIEVVQRRWKVEQIETYSYKYNIRRALWRKGKDDVWEVELQQEYCLDFSEAVIGRHLDFPESTFTHGTSDLLNSQTISLCLKK